jgi:hypothetical protein
VLLSQFNVLVRDKWNDNKEKGFFTLDFSSTHGQSITSSSGQDSTTELSKSSETVPDVVRLLVA